LFAQAAVSIAATSVVVSLSLTTDRESLIRDYQRAGSRLLIIYLPYAALIVLGFALRAIPSVDIRSITSTLIFGPLTLIRPVVAIAGLVYAVFAVPRPAVVTLGLIVLTMMLGLERALSFFRHLNRGSRLVVP
jgi:hypothetical protein